MSLTHGKCDTCKKYFGWKGRPRLRDALCPYCKEALGRTAWSLVKRAKLDAKDPLEAGITSDQKKSLQALNSALTKAFFGGDK